MMTTEIKQLDIKNFKGGNYIRQIEYRSFDPNLINLEWIVSEPEINQLLEQANLRLGALDAFSVMVPDVNTFIQMHILKEATTSSRIEGTQTHIGEAVLKERDLAPDRRDDWHEVQNYVAAMNNAINDLEKLPLSSRLFKTTHQTLLRGVRGKEKQPGEYRTSQNWIGGASLRDAVFVPPHHTSVNPLMGDLENFINNDAIHVPHLIRIAIAHYQFETIHPFLDGNGRLGRLLITLYLVQNGILHKPTLYLSDFFARNKALYYDNLMIVRNRSDLSQWVKFFLVAVSETAQQGVNTFRNILELRERYEYNSILTLGRKVPLAKQFITYLYSNPGVTAQDVQEEFKITKPTANQLITDFERLGILKEKTGFKRNRIFEFDEYLTLFT